MWRDRNLTNIKDILEFYLQSVMSAFYLRLWTQ